MVIDLQVVNIGENDIGVGDFGEPIRLSTNEGKIEDVISGGAEPPELTFKLSKPDGNAFYLEPLLLKRGEAITFSVLSTQKLNRLLVYARIKGIEGINSKSLLEGPSAQQERSIITTIFPAVVAFYLIFGFIIILLRPHYRALLLPAFFSAKSGEKVEE